MGANLVSTPKTSPVCLFVVTLSSSPRNEDLLLICSNISAEPHFEVTLRSDSIELAYCAVTSGNPEIPYFRRTLMMVGEKSRFYSLRGWAGSMDCVDCGGKAKIVCGSG
jgi:hypothetical protein